MNINLLQFGKFQENSETTHASKNQIENLIANSKVFEQFTGSDNEFRTIEVSNIFGSPTNLQTYENHSFFSIKLLGTRSQFEVEYSGPLMKIKVGDYCRFLYMKKTRKIFFYILTYIWPTLFSFIAF